MQITETGVDFAKSYPEEITSRGWELRSIPKELFQTQFSIKEWFLFSDMMTEIDNKMRFFQMMYGGKIGNDERHYFELEVSSRITVGVSNIHGGETEMFIRCFKNKDVHHTGSSLFTLTLDKGDFDNLRYHQRFIDEFITTLPNAHRHNKIHPDSGKDFWSCELCSEVSFFSQRSSRGFPKYDAHTKEKRPIYIPGFMQKRVKDGDGKEKVIGVSLNYAEDEWELQSGPLDLDQVG